MNLYSLQKSSALPLEYLQGDFFLPLAREVHLSRDFHLQGNYQRTGNSHGNGNRHMGLGFRVWGFGFFWGVPGNLLLVVSCLLFETAYRQLLTIFYFPLYIITMKNN